MLNEEDLIRKAQEAVRRMNTRSGELAEAKARFHHLERSLKAVHSLEMQRSLGKTLDAKRADAYQSEPYTRTEDELHKAEVEFERMRNEQSVDEAIIELSRTFMATIRRNT